MDELDRADELTEPLEVRWVFHHPRNFTRGSKGIPSRRPRPRTIGGWLTKGQTPSTDVLRQQSLEKRNLWSQVPAVHLFNGTLVRKFFNEDSAQLVVRHRLRKAFFDQSHSGPLAAHLGAQRSFLQLRYAYY